MFSHNCKQTTDLTLSIDTKFYNHVVILNRKLEQHTLFNGYDAYSPELQPESAMLTERASEYLQSLRFFESLYSKYRASLEANLQAAGGELFLKTKTATHTYALSAKGNWLGFVSMSNNQF
jgi:hypothetical protein